MRLLTRRLAMGAFLCGGLPVMVLADNDSLQQEVVCAETGFSQAAESRDLQRFLAFVDPDARFANAAVSRGKEEIAAAWAAVFDTKGPAMRWRPAITEVSQDGRLALSRGPYRSVRQGADGERIESWGHFISTWRKTADGEWLVLFDSGGDSGMTPTDAEVTLLESEPDCP
jgi:ketosteroid isomerase-like protein